MQDPNKEKVFKITLYLAEDVYNAAKAKMLPFHGKFQRVLLELLTGWVTGSISLGGPPAVREVEVGVSTDPERENLHRKLDEVLDSRNERYSQTVRGSIELIHEAMKSRR